MADRSPPARAASLRLEAARAYAAGGDSESARRQLGQAGGAVSDSQQLAAEAGVTLVRVLLDEGKVKDATQELARYRSALPGGVVQELSRQVALAWIRQGELSRADSLVARDSTVEGLALRGRLHLYRGELGKARTALQSAGPYAGTRDEVTSRTTILALLQSLEDEEHPALGAAFLTLARGDTTAAVQAFAGVGERLPAMAGGAEVLLLAGRLAAVSGHGDRAEALLRRAAAADSSSAAPAAMFELARVLVGLQRAPEALPVLEGQILGHPESAVVPQARRLLDELRGAVPKT
jgi:predicted negative regulator of RcsB-dependent stress response